MNFIKNVATFVCAIMLIDAMGSASFGQSQSYAQLAKAASWGATSRGWQLGIIGGAFTKDTTDIVVLVRNSGPSLGIKPIEPQVISTTLVDQNGKHVAVRDDWVAGELNTTGASGVVVKTNSIVKNEVHLYNRFKNLAPGTYRLTASTNIVPGTSMDEAVNKAVFAHLTSGTVAVTILPERSF